MHLFYAMGFRFRRSAAIAVPVPDHSTKHRLADLRRDLAKQRSISVSWRATGQERNAAKKRVQELTQKIMLLPTEAGNALRVARKDFDDRVSLRNILIRSLPSPYLR